MLAELSPKSTQTSAPTPALTPALTTAQMRACTDKYFSRTAAIMAASGDAHGLWAVYSRAAGPARWREAVTFMAEQLAQQDVPVILQQPGAAQQLGTGSKQPVYLMSPYAEGEVIAANEPVLYYYGAGSEVSELETGLLQRVVPKLQGLPQLLAQTCENATAMVSALWHIPFYDMGPRHCPVGTHAKFAFATALGSQQVHGAQGFVGSSTDESAPLYGAAGGMGSMPHALVGYAGSTLRACELFHAVYPDYPLTALVDFFGKEVTDSIAVGQRFNYLAEAGMLSARLDTHGARYLEGLDDQSSRAIIARHAPQMLDMALSAQEEKWLYGMGVSVAATFHLRAQLDAAGCEKMKILASSGFNARKCRIFALAHAPIDAVGTGSYLPEALEDTFAKSETLGFDHGQGFALRTKVGREWVGDKFRRDATLHGWRIPSWTAFA